MTDNELRAQVKIIADALYRMQGDKRVKVTSFPFTIATAGAGAESGFRLYVGTAGTLSYKMSDGVAVTETFTAGYHPTRFLEITSVGTAADVTAVF